MGISTAETIKNITRNHLVNNNGAVLCQNVCSASWVLGTVPSDIPDNKGIIELPTSDVSNGGVVTGYGLAGRRPIYIMRFSPFGYYNLITPLNYAAKSKELWNVPCPIFIRSCGGEGGFGPVASGAAHSYPAHFPGVKIFAPCRPLEYNTVWDDFLNGDDVVYCSESRATYKWTDDEPTFSIKENAKINVFLIGGARTQFKELLDKNWPINIFSPVSLKPIDNIFFFSPSSIKFNFIVDSDYQICGISEHIAYEIMIKTGVQTIALGLEDRTSGFSKHCDNTTISVADKLKDYL